MTREEAKRRMEICRDFLANNYYDIGEPNFTAFNMAIKALSSVTQKSGKCKTCKYWQDNNNGYPSDMCEWRTDETPDADDFCSGFEPQESETWNGYHAQITAPKGTFKKIYEDAESEEKE